MEELSCRTCLNLNKDSTLVSLYIQQDGETTIADILSEICQIQIQVKDNLPQFICKICLEKLKESKSFKSECVKNDIFLRKQLEQPVFQEVLVKSESPDNTLISSNLVQEIVLDNPSSNPLSTSKESTVRGESEFFKCGICFKIFKQKSNLNRHLEVHSKDKRFSCSTCKVTFSRKANLDIHMTNAHSCQLKRHTKINHANQENESDPTASKQVAENVSLKTIECFICDQKFFSKIEKNEHITEVHSAEAIHACSICKFLSTSAKYLDIHMKSHKVKKDFLCDRCSKSFYALQHLKEHVSLVHLATEESYSYACTSCPKKFKCSQNLRRHQEIHLNKKNFLCDQCQSSFSRKESLEVHLFKAHGVSTKSPLCEVCKNVFPNMSKLKRHQEKYKGECVEKFRTRTLEKNVEYICSYCQRNYKDKTHFESHVFSHTNQRPFKCQKCEKGFRSKTNLNSHKVICENLRQFGCNLCDQKFNKKETLEVHTRNSHTGEKPFDCSVCSKRFSSRKMFTKHLRNIHGIRQRKSRT